MKRMLLLLFCMVIFCLSGTAISEDYESCDLYIKKIDRLDENFYLGMDTSSMIALENAGVKYYDFDGKGKDLFLILKENGINLIRVRIWNDPYTSDGRSYGGGNCDIKTAVLIAERCAKYDMKLMVDFHYSDFWADPSKQMVPKAWKGMTSKEKGEKIYEYTSECLEMLKKTGVEIAIVQIGNETNGRFCGERVWMRIVYDMMAKGCAAVRNECPDALIAVHFANPENADGYLSYASKLAYYNLDYDVFATSYYPYWHGTIDNLKNVLSSIADTYQKKVMVAETSWAYTLADGDFSGNTIGEAGGYDKPFSISIQGQANEIVSVIEAMNEIGGIGVCYWEGAWIPVGQASWEKNHRLWEEYGAGWASSAAGEYDPDDAGKYYGGCACENQALFDFSGHALQSLKTFRLIKSGNIVPLRIDAAADIEVTCDLAGEIHLPETAPVVMNDGSEKEVPVIWDISDVDYKANGPADYRITGVAEGETVFCTLHMVEYNYLLNGDFENSDDSMWIAHNIGGTEQLYVEDKKTDSKSGTKHYHFYSAAANHVEFELEQKLESLEPGHYTFSISIMGGDAGEQKIYSYVKINGEMIDTQNTEITSWNSWHTADIGPFEVKNNNDVVTVGIYVQCKGSGAWGKIDDAKLNRMVGP